MIKLNEQVRIVGVNYHNVYGEVIAINGNEVEVKVPCYYADSFITVKVSLDEVVKTVKDGDKLSRKHNIKGLSK